MAELKTTISSLEAKKLNQSTIKNLKLAILHTVPNPKFPHKSISQKELCEKAGCGSNVISAFIIGRNNITLINLLSVCRALDLDPSCIITNRELTTTQIEFQKSLNNLDDIKLRKIISLIDEL
tara:strand:+ start:215 stop:583 length:369 start_codon:yes stop_codon:yes gene_type:complete